MSGKHQGWAKEFRLRFPMNQDGKDAFWRALRDAKSDRAAQYKAMLGRWREAGYHNAYDLMVDLVTARLGEPYSRSRDGSSCYWVIPAGDNRASTLRVSNHGISKNGDQRKVQRNRLEANIVLNCPTVDQWRAAKRAVVTALRGKQVLKESRP